MTVFAFSIVALLLIAIAVRSRMSFARHAPESYAATEPAIDPRHHLSGPIACDGMIHGPTGQVVSRFTAKMHGTWDGARGVLAENFTYATGTTQAREWRLQLGNDGTFTATADDVIGTAQGVISGSTIRLSYRLQLPKDSGGHVLTVTDWMYLNHDGVILNRSEMRKFGIKVAELFAVMRPDPTATA